MTRPGTRSYGMLHASSILFMIIMLFGCSDNSVRITNLTVEYTQTPLGIDVTQPRFAWQMQAPGDARGYEQTSSRNGNSFVCRVLRQQRLPRAKQS